MSGYPLPEQSIKNYLTTFVFVDDDIMPPTIGFEKKPTKEKTMITETEPEEIESLVAPATSSQKKVHTEALVKDFFPKVYNSISNKGYLCDLFRFESGKLEICKKVCKRSDVVILDWELDPNGTGHAPSLKIIKSIYENNGLRFIYIYSVVENLDEIRSMIEDELDFSFEGDDKLNFHKDSLYIFVRGKRGSRNKIDPDKILTDVISAISKKYTGIMSTFGLEFASNIKDQLPILLGRYNEKTDSPLVNIMKHKEHMEEFYRILPDIFISDARNTLTSKTTDSAVIDKTSVSAFMEKSEFIKYIKETINTGNQQNMKQIGNRILRLLIGVYGKNSGIKVKTYDENDKLELKTGTIKNSKKFLRYASKISGEAGLPKNIQGLNWDYIQNKKELYSQLVSVLCYLSLSDYTLSVLRLDMKTIANDMISNHCDFQCLLETVWNETNEINLTQGTILKDEREYYLCITPLCDMFRSEKIDNKFLFIRGVKISEDEVAFANRDRNSYSIVYENSSTEKPPPITIKWNLFDMISFEILDTKIESDKPLKVKAVRSPGADANIEEKELSYVGQLRLDYTLSIINKSSARMGRVGIDKDELIRLRSECRS